MTLITISQRLLQGIACTIVLEASALAQVPGQVPGLPAQVPGLPAQVSGLPGLPAPGIPFPTAIPRPPMAAYISERDAQRAATAPADRTAPRDRNPR
jgi:hypothetical protein